MQAIRSQIACRRGGGGSIGLPARLDTVRSLTPLASAFRLPAVLTLRGFFSVSWYDLQCPLCDAVKHDSASTCQFTFTVHAEAAKILGHCLHDLWSSYVNPTGENAPAGRSAVAPLAHDLVLQLNVVRPREHPRDLKMTAGFSHLRCNLLQSCCHVQLISV